MSGVDVSAMKYPELKEALTARGLDTRGTKAALAARLKSAIDADPTAFPKRNNGQPAFVSGGVWQAPVPPSSRHHHHHSQILLPNQGHPMPHLWMLGVLEEGQK